MIEQTYKLSMIPFEEQVRRNYEIPIVPASQYDKTLRTLSFELYNGEDRFTIPDEAVVYIFGMKPDGNAFQYQMTVEDNVAKIAMQTQMTTVAGCVTCEIVLFEENTSGPRIGSANFKMAVEKAAVGDDAQFSESDMPVIQTLLFGGTPGDILVKDVDGVKWNSEPHSVGYMRYDQYDPGRTGTVNSARQANNAATVDGHTVARNVLANEYTNEQIDESFRSVREEISDLDSVAVKSVNSIQPDQNGNVQLSKANIGLGNVDNTSDADKPISSAAQEALNQKVDKVPGMGLSQNSFTDTEKEKLGALPTSAELTAELSEKVDKEAGKGLSTNDFTTPDKTKLNDLPTAAELETSLNGKVDKETGKGLSSNDFTTEEKNKLAGIEAGAEVNVQANWDQTVTTADDYIQNKPTIPENTSDLVNDSGFITAALAPVQGVKGSAESAYRTGSVSIDKANIGLGNVDNTSDADKPISTAVQTALDAKANNSNIATIEAGTTATQTYSAGDNVLVGGQLYKVTDDIAVGETFTAGTNVEAKTIGDQLSELNKGLTNLNTLARLTINRTISTTYLSNTALNRLRAFKHNGMLTLILNLNFDGTALETSDFTEIFSISGWTSAFDSYITIPKQADFTVGILVQITVDGKVRVYSTTPINGFHRGCVTIPCA